MDLNSTKDLHQLIEHLTDRMEEIPVTATIKVPQLAEEDATMQEALPMQVKEAEVPKPVARLAAQRVLTRKLTETFPDQVEWKDRKLVLTRSVSAGELRGAGIIK